MKRREFVAVLGGAVVWPLAAGAQTKDRIWRVGILGSKPPTTAMLQAFREGLREQGYIEGRNLLIDVRSLEESVEPAKLIHRDVDVIVAWASPAVIAASRATKSIPIIMVGVGDPVGARFVASLARPGGNITGVSSLAADIGGKVVELLIEIVPSIRRIGVIRNPDNPGAMIIFRETESALQKLGLDTEVFDANTASGFESAFASFSSRHVEGVVLAADPSLVEHETRIAQFAQNARLPTVFQRRENVEAGGLLSYGPNLNEQWRRTAIYVDRIFKGALPAELPVEQPTKLELVINRNAARALGVTIPAALIARADEVIE